MFRREDSKDFNVRLHQKKEALDPFYHRSVQRIFENNSERLRYLGRGNTSLVITNGDEALYLG